MTFGEIFNDEIHIEEYFSMCCSYKWIYLTKTNTSSRGWDVKSCCVLTRHIFLDFVLKSKNFVLIKIVATHHKPNKHCKWWYKCARFVVKGFAQLLNDENASTLYTLFCGITYFDIIYILSSKLYLEILIDAY